MKSILRNTLGVLMCLLLTVLIVALTRGIHYLWSESRATGGFDYSEVLDNERFIWTGPNIPKTLVFETLITTPNIIFIVAQQTLSLQSDS